MREIFGGVARWFLRISAAALWAAVATVLALAAAGQLEWPRCAAALGVLRAELAAVPPAELATIRAARQELAEYAALPTYPDLRQAANELEAQRRRQQTELAAETERLLQWQASLTRMQQSISADMTRWRTERSELVAAAERARADLASRADARILALYRQLEASQIAEDLAVRFRAGGSEREAAARLLASMPERQAAEALAEIADASVRTQLLDEMRRAIERSAAGGET